MISYLKNFFEEFEYERDDAEFLLSSYERVCENKAALEIWNDALKLYNDNVECDYMAIIAAADKVASMLYIHEYTLEFMMFVCMTKRLRERYEEAGLDLSIYHNTILDLRYKIDECKLVRSIIGSFVATWFIDFFKMRRFALGRLQFEIVSLGYNYNKGDVHFTPESRVLNIHIPRSLTPLDEALCDEACLAAKEFFKGQYDEPCAFVCHSWLLYPENEKIIPRHTNTYKFFKRFDLIDSAVSKDNKDLWRLFDTDERNFDRLPQNSSIRRAYVDHLKNGGKTGWGMGIFFI